MQYTIKVCGYSRQISVGRGVQNHDDLKLQECLEQDDIGSFWGPDFDSCIIVICDSNDEILYVISWDDLDTHKRWIDPDDLNNTVHIDFDGDVLADSPTTPDWDEDECHCPEVEVNRSIDLKCFKDIEYFMLAHVQYKCCL